MPALKLEKKQGLAFQSEANELLYGGAAGGGKSYYLRVSAIRWCMEVPGIQVYLFRRTLPDLRDNHLRGPTSFQIMLEEYTKSGHVKFRTVENEFEWWNGAILHLCYCDSENDVEKYRGAEIHVLLMDELTHFSEYQYRFLRSRVRVAGLKIPDAYKPRLPRIECGSNPGSIGHAWVKRTFITPKPPLEIWKAGPSEGGMKRQFIPARLKDNPHLTKDDPDYADRLRGLGADVLVKAMLDGDWNLVAGQAFEKLNRDVHGIEPFEIPKDWLRFGSLDWGSARPFSYGMWAISDGEEVSNGKRYPRGAMIRYREFYGWNGKPNEGLRMEAREVALEILKLEDGDHMTYRIADSSMWQVNSGPSIAEQFNRVRCYLRPAPKGPGSRHNGYVEVRQRIAGNEDGPMLYAFTTCHNGFWRTMPDLVLDDAKYGLNSEQIECWVAGTLISTPNGGKAIERVVQGDTIDTPIGPRQVLKSYVSGASETVKVLLSNGAMLEGTPQHKIFVHGKGLVPLDEVECFDILYKRNTPWHQKLLFIKVRFSTFIKGIGTMSEGSTCTSRYGLTRMGKFLPAITFTTRMMTQRITVLGTSNAFLPPLMLGTTSTLAQPCAQSRKYGRIQRKVEQYFLRLCRSAVKTHQAENLRAAIVESISKPHILPKNSVPSGVRKITTGSKRNARSVVKDLWLNITGLEKYKPVRIVAVGRSEEKKQVFNLTVEQAHLFYANGILSSNTDQEDHCSDEVMYACVSRPWMRHVDKEKPKEDTWMRFDKPEEESWMTA